MDFCQILQYALLGAALTAAGGDASWSSEPSPDAPPVCALSKGREVNWRTGPGAEHGIRWSYHCPGWPVSICKTWEQWHLVRDAEGYMGWVHQSLLRYKRGGRFLCDTFLYSSPTLSSSRLARIKKGAIARILKAKPQWYYVQISSYRGWVPTASLWDAQSLTQKEGVTFSG